MSKVAKIALEASPVVMMVALIPIVHNDYVLTLLYTLIICFAFVIKKEKRDGFIFFFGLITMTISETFFLMTGVETFNRVSLFGIMPIWLPLLWAYGFVAIKRGITIIEH